MTARHRTRAAVTPAVVAEQPRTYDVPYAQHGREVRAFARALLAMSAEELAEVDARHRAAGYGGAP